MIFILTRWLKKIKIIAHTRDWKLNVEVQNDKKRLPYHLQEERDIISHPVVHGVWGAAARCARTVGDARRHWHTLTDCKVREDGSHRAERGEGLTTGQVHRWRGPDTGLGALTLTREHHKVIYPAPLGLQLQSNTTILCCRHTEYERGIIIQLD